MNPTYFPFIQNKILRQNLDVTFRHILTLIPITKTHSNNSEAQSAFRKTIIIHTASIVEALLYSLMDNKFTDEDIANHYAKWELKNTKELYEIDSGAKIVAGKYKLIPSKTNKTKMNLGQIVQFLKYHKVLSQGICKQIDQLRKMRNDQHIGAHRMVKQYTNSDIEKAFAIAKQVKTTVQNKLEK